MDLVERSEDIFELTLATFKPADQERPLMQRAARRVRVFEKKSDYGTFNPDIDKVMQKLHTDEGIRQSKLISKAYKEELRASTARLERVKRGVPLFSILESGRKNYPMEKPKMIFNSAEEEIIKIPDNYNGPPPKKLQLILPVSDSEPKMPPLISKINNSDSTKLKLQGLYNRSEEIKLRSHNEMIDFLNHANERRPRAMREFYDDAIAHGFRSARIRAQRKAQKSRLRIISQYGWWNEFLDYAFSKPVTRTEEKLIIEFSRIERLTSSSFCALVHEVKTQYPRNERCLELLNWINSHCQIVDENVGFILEEPIESSQSTRAPRRIASAK